MRNWDYAREEVGGLRSEVRTLESQLEDVCAERDEARDKVRELEAKVRELEDWNRLQANMIHDLKEEKGVPEHTAEMWQHFCRMICKRAFTGNRQAAG